jgi:lipopolysaccharide/colanic/teichoic acid biosynthesis glycosyltransferase
VRNGQFERIVDVESTPTPKVKRAVDVVISSIALVLLAPLLIVIGLLVKADSSGSALFTQRRVGKGGSTYRMYKFRTMVADAEDRLASLQGVNRGGEQLIRIPSDPRITRAGRWLRPLGLDELPQLYNVLRGEMSLIGPRPQSPSEVLLYDEHQRRRLTVLPGITGLWQVTSRDNPSFDEWVRCDLDYIENWSLLVDASILAKTPIVLLRGLLRTGEERTSEPVHSTLAGDEVRARFDGKFDQD